MTSHHKGSTPVGPLHGAPVWRLRTVKPPGWKESCLEDGWADDGFARGTAVFLFMAFVSGAHRMAGSCGCIVPVTASPATMTGHQTPN